MSVAKSGALAGAAVALGISFAGLPVIGIAALPVVRSNRYLLVPAIALVVGVVGLHVVYIGTWLPLQLHLDTSQARVVSQLLFEVALVMQDDLTFSDIDLAGGKHTFKMGLKYKRVELTALDACQSCFPVFTYNVDPVTGVEHDANGDVPYSATFAGIPVTVGGKPIVDAVANAASRLVPLTCTSIGVGSPRFSTASTSPPDWK